jgi:ArsR family transcriptional regulator, arsenate/arsenite/antimonite-responsive transcriptional repressor
MPANHSAPESLVSGTTCATRQTELRLSNEQAQRLAGLAKVLGHPVRLQIVELLSRYSGEVCVCDIEGHFDLTQPTISHHLKVLREAGIVSFEQRGLWVHYTLIPRVLEPLRELLNTLQSR